MEAGTTTIQITMPEMGESVTEGTILAWLKQIGDEVELDEGIVEVSTDKVDTEVPAPAGGVLTKILVEPDETVPVGTVLGEIALNGATAPSPGNGGAPERVEDPEWASDESAVEEAEHGAAAEDEYERAKEESDGVPIEPAQTAPTPPGTDAEGVDVKVPEMGEAVSEGTILDWLVKVGDEVERDQGLVEVSTDKVDAELPSPVAGVVVEILAEPDDVVATGTVVARIAVGDRSKEQGARSPAEATAQAAEVGQEPAPASAEGHGAEKATPVAARMAAANGIDLGELKGTGPRGRVTKDDVENAMAGNGAPAAPQEPDPRSSLVAPEPGTTPIRGPAATLARFMNESRSIPTATSFRTLEVDRLDERRKALKAAGKKLSFTHLIAWAIVRAAEDMPVMGNAYTEADGKPQRIVPEQVSLGLAVDVERKDGTRSLGGPVLGNASSRSFPDFVGEYDRLVAGARDNTLGPDDYSGANISLTNPGGIGTVASVPRLMPGQGTIVATGAISYPPGLTKSDPVKLRELGVAKVMTMTSTYDHRVIQGAESGAFLRRIDQLLQGDDNFYELVFEELGIDAHVPPAGVEDRRQDGAGPVTAAEPAPSPVRPGADADLALLQAVQAATSVVKAHRMHGHLAARLDPLGSEPESDPALEPATVNLTPELMRAIPASVLRVAVPGETFADALPHLQETYTGTIAYEIEHIADHEQRVWLRQTIESGEHRQDITDEDRRTLLEKLTESDVFEGYLHKAFLGKKQFSLEGLDVVIPMLDQTLELASEAGAAP